MSEPSQRKPRTRLKRSEIIIALIGLIGILATAVFSNWDKLFPKDNSVQATYSGYRPTGDFETELRYYFEVSGMREAIDVIQKQTTEQLRADVISRSPQDADVINRYIDLASKEAPTLEEFIKLLTPLYQKYFTVAELQELNRFYSTDAMRTMVKKMPLLIQESTPLQIKSMNDYENRVRARIEAEWGGKLRKQLVPCRPV